MRQTSMSVSLAQRLVPPGQVSVQLPGQAAFVQLPVGHIDAGPQVGQLAETASQTWMPAPAQRLLPTVQEHGTSPPPSLLLPPSPLVSAAPLQPAPTSSIDKVIQRAIPDRCEWFLFRMLDSR
jgi:hypothetical protein